MSTHNICYGTCKCPKIWNTLFHTILTKILLFMQLFLIIHVHVLSGMTNNVDTDQTAPAVWSGSALFAYVIFSDILVFENLSHLRYISKLEKYYVDTPLI